MDRRKRVRLDEHELSVMHLFWESGEAPHEDAETAIRAAGYSRDEAAEIVRNLVHRGVLDHREESSTYVYSPLISRREVADLMLHDIVDSLFQGSREELLRALVDHDIFTADELASAAADIASS